MDELTVNRELLSFDEKIYLAKLEVKKAEERVSVLEYDKARFTLEDSGPSKRTVYFFFKTGAFFSVNTARNILHIVILRFIGHRT